MIDAVIEMNNERNSIMAMRIAAFDVGDKKKINKMNKKWRNIELKYFSLVKSLPPEAIDLIQKHENKELRTFRKVL